MQKRQLQAKQCQHGRIRPLKDNWKRQSSAAADRQAMPDSARRDVRWFIDCGDDDFLYEGNSLAHIALRKARNTTRIQGARWWDTTGAYWRAGAAGGIGVCQSGISSVLIEY